MPGAATAAPQDEMIELQEREEQATTDEKAAGERAVVRAAAVHAARAVHAERHAHQGGARALRFQGVRTATSLPTCTCGLCGLRV